jgi:hypothetical protein
MLADKKKVAQAANLEKARAARGASARQSLRQTRGSASSTADYLQEFSLNNGGRVSEIPLT